MEASAQYFISKSFIYKNVIYVKIKDCSTENGNLRLL